MCNWTETKMKHVALYLEKEQAKAPSTYSDDVHLPNRSRPLELKENGNIQGCSSGLLLDFADFDFLSSAHNTLPPKLLWHFCRMLSCPGRTRQTPEQPDQSQQKVVDKCGCPSLYWDRAVKTKTTNQFQTDHRPISIRNSAVCNLAWYQFNTLSKISPNWWQSLCYSCVIQSQQNHV